MCTFFSEVFSVIVPKFRYHISAHTVAVAFLAIQKKEKAEMLFVIL